MIKLWAKELEKYGFNRLSKKDPSLIREIGHLRNIIFENRNRHDKDKVFIRIGIQVLDKFYSEPRYLIAYAINLPRTKELKGDDALNDSWHESEYDTALKDLLSKGMEWFDKYSDLDSLIKYFETGWREERIANAKKASDTDTWFTKMLHKSMGIRIPDFENMPLPPANHHYLGLLYFEAGKNFESYQHAKKYLEFINGRKTYEEEPERTLRLINELGYYAAT